MNLLKTLQASQFAPEDLEKIRKIKKILYKINTVFHDAEPAIGTLQKTSNEYDFLWIKGSSKPITRDEYITRHPEILDALDFSFSLSADDIIEQKIPMQVMGCTGIAKLFAKYAQEESLDCLAVYTAKIDQLKDKQKNMKSEKPVSGHQIIAVQFSDGVRMFDPGLDDGLKFYKDSHGQEIVVDVPRMLLGKELGSQKSKDPWAERQAGAVITCIEPAQRLENVKSYSDLEKKYLQNHEPIVQTHEV